jgi:hypothetical protein
LPGTWLPWLFQESAPVAAFIGVAVIETSNKSTSYNSRPPSAVSLDLLR